MNTPTMPKAHEELEQPQGKPELIFSYPANFAADAWPAECAVAPT